MAYLCGIDLGTSSLKTLLMDEQGSVKGVCARSYQFASPRGGFAEQDPREWWEACCRTVRGVLKESGISGSDVAAVSFSGQMHGAVLLDETYQVIRPAILHCDARSGEQVEQMKETLGEERVRQWVMNPIYTGFLLPSLLWVRENEPENFRKIRHVCLPKDYLKFRMSGELSSDYSDASATLAFDIKKGGWSKEILQAFEIPEEFFPACFYTAEAAGAVCREAAEETGLSERTLVVAGGGDQVMQGIGNGAIRTGMATVNIGSSGQFSFQSGSLVTNAQLNTNTFCGYEKNRWIVMGAIMNAGLSLKWINRVLGQNDFEAVNRVVEQVKPGSGGLLFLPYLNGERTPHLNPDLSGAFLGMSFDTSPASMTRAVMEGVSFALYQCMELCEGLGLKAEELIASGGGARSKPWLQIQSDIYNMPLKVADTEEQAGLGAAIAAAVGAGIYASVEEGCRQAVHYQDFTVIPDPENHRIYREYYQLYKEAYQGSREVLEKVTRLGRSS